MVRTSSRARWLRRFVPYRPFVERLEERLPPGDAVLAGLLAADFLPSTGRAAGLVPAEVRAAPPGQARRLADPAPFDLTADLELLGENPAPASPVALAPGGLSAAPTLGDLGAITQPRSPARSVAPIPASPVASAPGEGGTPYSVLGTPHSVHGALTQPRSLGEPTNYQLDQTVAALPPAEGARAGGVQALFDLGHPTTGPFPSNWFTVFDDTQNTWRRVNLPYPDCTVYVSDCEDIAVLNELDGFNLQPRLSIPFSGPIDVNSVNSGNVFLVSLGSTTDDDRLMPRGYGVGINQVVWDVATNTLHVESDELLAQHTRFALYVTTGVLDTQGNPVAATEDFRNFRQTVEGDYREHLHDAMLMAGAFGFRERDIAVASVFTTQSTTAILEKIRDQIKAQTPEPADFLLGEKGERTVFHLDEVTGIRWDQQIRVDPPEFNSVNLNLSFLRDIIPGAVSQLAFGKYVSPDYEVHPGEFIPSVGTGTGTPMVQGANEIYFNLVLPTGPMPKGGWPVAIFGHGSGQDKGLSFNVAAKMAEQGIATVAINAVGYGFGPLGTLAVSQAIGGPVTLFAGGRGIDQNGDRTIGSAEGVDARAPRTIMRDRDGLRQTAADLMQLVGVIGVGMDVDGDGSPDLNPSHVSYVGYSLGGNYGTQFLAVEPDVAAGVPNVAVGSQATRGVLSPVFRPSRGTWLAQRTPPLVNPPGVTHINGIAVGMPRFDDNTPLRDGVAFTVRLEDETTREVRSPVINTVGGAMAIQEMFEHAQWATLSGDALAYIPHLRRAPLAGVPAKPILFQFGKGDQNVPNPVSSALLRAGDLADRATFYRHDLAVAENPALQRNAHQFLVSIGNAAWREVVLGAQSQIATFFASEGKTIIHPEPARFFEVPIQGPLPEGLNFIP